MKQAAQQDFIGGGAPERVDRNNLLAYGRPSVAETKDGLVRHLERLCNQVPSNVRSGSIQKVREWATHQAKAVALTKKSRVSVPELEMAIKQLEAWRE